MLQILLGDDFNIPTSASIQGLLDSAKKIDDYMADNGFTYSQDYDFNKVYNEGDIKYACCATFVSWCLQDAGFISNSEHVNSVDGIIETLEKHSDEWKKVYVKDMSELQPGDVGIYKNNGDSHANIYAGDSMFWDAGTPNKVETKGVTSHNLPSSYVFRCTK